MTLSELREACHKTHWEAICHHGGCNPNKPDKQCKACREARQMALELSKRIGKGETVPGDNNNQTYWFNWHAHKLIKDVMGW